MKYEIRYLFRADEDTIEETSTRDEARLRALKLSKKELGTSFVIFCFDNGKRTPCSFAKNGMVYWPKECRECSGKGRISKHSACYDCEKLGYVMGDLDRDEGGMSHPYRTATVIDREDRGPRPYVERRDGELYLMVPFSLYASSHTQWMAVPIDPLEARAIANELDNEVKTHDPMPGVPNLFKKRSP